MPQTASNAGLSAAALVLMGAAAPAQQPFDPVAFFTGPTHGKGALKELIGKEKRTTTQSVGHVDKDGWLVLDQKVLVEGDPVRQRRWRLKLVSPGKYSGTLSDAKGTVHADIVGQTVRIRYTMKDGIKVQQLLTPHAGGRSIDNRATFHKWGVKVATLNERIDKQ